MSEWECAFYCADVNLDGKVSRTQLTQWLKTNEVYSRSEARITMLDHGDARFALVDAELPGSTVQAMVGEILANLKALDGAEWAAEETSNATSSPIPNEGREMRACCNH